MNVKHIASSFLAMLLFTVGGSVGAEHHEKAPKDPAGKYFWVDTATVVGVDVGARTLQVTDPLGSATYVVDDATLIREGSDTLALGDLGKGDRIAISAHEGPGVRDRPVADTITVVIVDPVSGEPNRRKSAVGK